MIIIGFGAYIWVVYNASFVLADYIGLKIIFGVIVVGTILGIFVALEIFFTWAYAASFSEVFTKTEGTILILDPDVITFWLV